MTIDNDEWKSIERIEPGPEDLAFYEEVLLWGQLFLWLAFGVPAHLLAPVTSETYEKTPLE